MRPGLAKIIGKVHISRRFESSETDLHIVETACSIDHTDTGLSKQVDWLSKCQTMNHSTSNYEYENWVEFDSGVAWVSLRIARIHPQGAQKSTIQPLLATLHNTEWMAHHQVRQGGFKPIPILDPVDVNIPYSYSGSRRHCLQWHVRSYVSCYVSFR